MAKMIKMCSILMCFWIQMVWGIYIVPDHTKNQVMDTLEMKQQNGDEQIVKHVINSNGTSASTTTTTAARSIIAMHARNGQLHHTSYDKNDDVAVTYSHKDDDDENENFFENLEAQPNSAQEGSDSHTRQRRDLFVFPNTKWCGKGNTANGTYNHLGGASNADKCCRKHDHCKAFIPAMSNRYDLFNYRPYTLSHCSCDRRFRTCLKMANDEDAKTIGQLFFNMVQTQCFVLTKERVCSVRSADGTCAQEHVKQKAYLRNNKKF